MGKQVERLFDMLCYLRDGGEGDFVLKTKSGEKKFEAKEIQAFAQKKLHEYSMSGYGIVEGTKVAIQAFTGSTDLAKIETNVWNAFQETPNFDMFWQEAFRSVPLRKGQLDWSVGTVVSGTVFKELAEGEKVEYASIKGTGIKASVELYGSGLEISWKTIEGRDLASFFNAMVDFRNKRAVEWADVHYGLLAASASTNPIAYQGEATDTILDRDILTLNEGYNEVGEATKDSGYGETANARMILYVSPRLKQRLNQAMRVTSALMASSGGQGQVTMDSNIDIRYTYNDAIGVNKGVLVLPGNKIQNSVYMQEKNFERINPDNLSWLKSSFTAFGAIVGDNDQAVELSFE